MRIPLPTLRTLPVAGRRDAARSTSLVILEKAAKHFDLLPDPIFVVDDARRYLFVNRAGCRAFRMKHTAILRRRIDDFADPEMRRHLDQIWAAFLQRGKARSELRYRVAGGWTATFETNSRANFLPGLHLSVLRDITQRTAALKEANRRLRADVDQRRAHEAALRESEHRYRTVFHRANNAIIVVSFRDGIVLDANRRAAQLYGYRLCEFIGMSLKTSALSQVSWRRGTRWLLREGSVENAEFVRRRPDGKEVLLSSNATLIEYGGQPAVLAVIRDVTEHRRMEAALRRSESRLRAARDASLDAFYIVESVRDPRGRITDFRFVDANHRGAALLSRSRRELVGKNMCELFPFARPQGVFEKFKRVVETKRAHVDIFPIAIPDIKANWIHEHSVPVGDGIAITSRDISDEMQVRQALRRLSWKTLEAQEAERRRVARDLHDGVGQWLTAARFRLQATDSRLRGAGARSRRTLASVRRELAAAKHVVAKALSEVRRISHHLRPGELDDLGLAAAVRGLCRETAKRAGLKIELRCARLKQRPSRMVEEALYRIVQEGLTNVERHAHARHVWIRLRQRSGQIWLEIRDDGRGISARRMRSSTGAGLGNMQERAALAGGSFVRRSAPGRGTEIFVQLPLLTPATRSHDR